DGRLHGSEHPGDPGCCLRGAGLVRCAVLDDAAAPAQDGERACRCAHPPIVAHASDMATTRHAPPRVSHTPRRNTDATAPAGTWSGRALSCFCSAQAERISRMIAAVSDGVLPTRTPAASR